MATITQLTELQKQQKETEYREKLKKTNGYNFGGVILASTAAAMIYPLYKGIFKYLDVLVGNSVILKAPKLIDLAIDNSRIVKAKTSTFTQEEIATLAKGFKAATTVANADQLNTNIDLYERVLKTVFGSVEESAPGNFFTSTIKNSPDLSLSKLLTQVVLPFPAISTKSTFVPLLNKAIATKHPLLRGFAHFSSAYLDFGGGRFGTPSVSAFLAYKTAATVMGVENDNVDFWNFSLSARPLMAISKLMVSKGPGFILKTLTKSVPDALPAIEKLVQHVQNLPEVTKSAVSALNTGIFKNWTKSSDTLFSTLKSRFKSEFSRQIAATNEQSLWVAGTLSDIYNIGIRSNQGSYSKFIQKTILETQDDGQFTILKAIENRIDELKVTSTFYNKKTGYEEMTVGQFLKLKENDLVDKVDSKTIDTIKDRQTDIKKLKKVIQKSRVGDDALREKFLTSIDDLKVGPGVFYKAADSGKTPVFVKNKLKSLTDNLKVIESSTKIPILGFSPVSLFQPTTIQSRLYRPFIVKFGKEDVLTTSVGALPIDAVLRFASQFPDSVFIKTTTNEFSVWQIGSTKYAVDTITQKKVDLASIGLGSTEILKRAESAGGIGRTLAEQLGIVKERAKNKNGLQEVWALFDLPGDNSKNFEETMWKQGFRSFQNITGQNVIAKAMRKINKGTTLSYREIAAVFQFTDYVSLQKMDPEFLNTLVGLTENTLEAASRYSARFSKLRENINQILDSTTLNLTDNDRVFITAINNRINKELSGTKSTIVSEARGILTDRVHITQKFFNTTLGNTDITYREVVQRMALMESMFSQIATSPISTTIPSSGIDSYLDSLRTSLKQKIINKSGQDLIEASRGYVNAVEAVDTVIETFVKIQTNPDLLSPSLASAIRPHIPSMSKSILPGKSTNIFDLVKNSLQRYQTLADTNKADIHFSVKNSQRYYSIFTDFDIFRQMKKQSSGRINLKISAGLDSIMSPMSFLFPKDGQGVSYAGTILQWIVERPIEGLFEPLGLGRVNPTKTRNAWQVMKETFLKKILPIVAVVEGFNAIDAIAKNNNPDKDSPKEALAKFAGNTQVGILNAAEHIGIPQAMEYMRENYPGLMSAVGVAGSLLTGGTERQILLSGMVMSLFENLPRHAQLKRELEGEKNVAVRSGRWWELGRTPYQGGKVTHWRPALQYLNTTSWQYSQEKYGSPLEYLAFQNMFPTPFNLFGLNLVLPPMSYYWEMKHYSDRPYPVTGASPLANIPLLGKIISPLTELIKPRIRMHTDELASAMLPENILQPAMPVLPANVSDSYSGSQRGAEAAIKPFSFSLTTTTSAYETSLALVRSSYTNMVEGSNKNIYSVYSDRFKELTASPGFFDGLTNAVDFFKDWTGMSGFMIANYSVSGLDNKSVSNLKQRIASPDSAFSANTAYYQQYLGSVFGMSELLRRTIQNDYSMYEDTYNPLRNTMPDWLPGGEYFVDFLRGDPYAKIPFGEVRLPGEAYEMSHTLQDDYGPIDRGVILLNVAPWSTQAKASESAFMQMLDNEESLLTAEQRYKMISALTEAETQRKKYEFSNYVFSTPYTDKSVKVEKYLGDGLFQIAGEKVPFKAYGIETSVDKIAKKIYETKDTSIESALDSAQEQRQDTDEYYQSLVGKTVQITIPEDQNQAYRMEDKDVYLSGYIEEAIANAKKESPDALSKTTDIDKRASLGTNVLKQVWEQVAHRWGFFQEKFWPQKSAAEEYERYNVYGQYSAQWSKPIQDFLMPIIGNIANINPLEAGTHGAMLGVMTGTTFGSKLLLGGASAIASTIFSAVTPEGYIPGETSKRWKFEEKYDFAKGIRSMYAGEINMSVAGMAGSESLEAMSLNLPRIEREFLQEFVNAPQSEWDKLSQHTPEYMNTLVDYARNLKFKKVAGDTEVPPFNNDYKQRFIDQALNVSYEELSENPMYNPDFNLEAMKTYEAYYNFSDMSKVYIYDDDIRKAVVSFLQQPIPSFSDSSYFYLLEQMEMMEMIKRYGALTVMPSLNSQISEQRW